MVIEAAEGNPFYIEELVTWLVEAGVVVKAEPHWLVVDELIDSVAVPPNAPGACCSRAWTLWASTERPAAPARVRGRPGVLGLRRGAPRRRRRALTTRRRARHAAPTEVVLQREVSRFAAAREYLFKHALLRDVAYDGILRAQRERYHRGAAQWLTETSAAVGGPRSTPR